MNNKYKIKVSFEAKEFKAKIKYYQYDSIDEFDYFLIKELYKFSELSDKMLVNFIKSLEIGKTGDDDFEIDDF